MLLLPAANQHQLADNTRRPHRTQRESFLGKSLWRFLLVSSSSHSSSSSSAFASFTIVRIEILYSSERPCGGRKTFGKKGQKLQIQEETESTDKNDDEDDVISLTIVKRLPALKWCKRVHRHHVLHNFHARINTSFLALSDPNGE